MSKAITNALKAHLAQTTTTLATCWQITRRDGMMFNFTSLDQDLVVDSVTYSSIAGFSRSAIHTGSHGGVDNLEVSGFFASDGITAQDLNNGLFNQAAVSIFLVNWKDLSQGILRLRHGWLGEAVRAPDGMFTAELRGLTQALVQEFGNYYSPLCRADFGDALCKIPVLPPLWQAGTPYAAGSYVRALTQSSDARKVAIFLSAGGTSGGSEPSWDTTIGHTTTDNTITWTSKPYFRGIGTVVTPLSQQSFTTAGLSLPGVQAGSANSAVISVRNNVSAGTRLQITDGILTVEFFTAQDIRGYGDHNNVDAYHMIYALIVGGTVGSITFPPSGLQISVVQSSFDLLLTNTSGQPANLTKTGDVLGGIVIANFAASTFNASTITWITGSNAGASIEMKSFDTGSGTVTLWLAANYPIQAGDTFFFDAGCDKTRATCQNRYNNIINNRSEPDMPGMDAVLSYPDI